MSGEPFASPPDAPPPARWSEHPFWTWLTLFGAAVTLAIAAAKSFGYADSIAFVVIAVVSAAITTVTALMTKILKDLTLRRAAWRVAGVGAMAAMLVAFLAILDPEPTPVPPRPMAGDINVAVGEFAASGVSADVEGEAISLAGNLYAELDERLLCGRSWPEGSLRAGFQFDCRPPDEVGQIAGADAAARTAAAAATAAEVKADILVYGTVTDDNGTLTFAPEMYISDRQLAGARELSGYHELPVQEGDVRLAATRRDLRARLRSEALDVSDFILALSVYAHGDFEEGLAVTEAVIARDTWHFGSELLHLLAGNLHGQLGELELAEESYEASLAVNDRYARALLGLAEVDYQRSIGSARVCAPGDVDADGIEAAIAGFEAAIDVDPDPQLADVEEKAWFGIARCHICLLRAGLGGDRETADALLDGVVGSYDAGRTSLRDLAADSYTLIGQVALETAAGPDDYHDAVAALTVALELSADPEDEASSHALLGLAFQNLNQVGDACEHFRQAIALTDDDERRTDYVEVLGGLDCP